MNMSPKRPGRPMSGPPAAARSIVPGAAWLGALQPARLRQPEITTLTREAGDRGVPECLRDCGQCHTAAG